jgi:hypothetical protein
MAILHSRFRFLLLSLLVACFLLLAGSLVSVHAVRDETRRALTLLPGPYRESALKGWKIFQTSYAHDGVACVHCHRDHQDMIPWAGAYPKVQLFDGMPYGVKTLRMVILEALSRHSDVGQVQAANMAEDLAAYISWWGDGQLIIPGISEAVPPPVEDLVELQNAVTRGRGLFNREKPLSCAYCHTTGGERLMDSQKVHQAGYTRSVHPGVGVEPGGFTPPGGGSRQGRDRPMQNGSERLFARLSRSNYLIDLSQSYSRFPIIAEDGIGVVSLHAYLAAHRQRMGVFMGSDDIPDLAAYLADRSRGLRLTPGGQTQFHKEPADVENVD